MFSINFSEIKDFLKFSIDHMEGIAGFLSLFVALKVYSQSNKDKSDSSHEKRIEIYMNLFQQWDGLWANITAFPEKNKDLFKRSLNDLEDENLRLAVSNAVALLSRVYFYYSQTNQKIETSEWHQNIKYVFSKNLFNSAYQKHEHRYSPEFRSYITQVRKEIKSQNGIIDISISKKDSKNHNIVR